MASFASVTILIPCFNQPQLLHRCLDSVRNQTFHDFTIILVDDCSSISYQKIIEINNDLPILYVNNELNLGAVPNMIHCIKYPVNSKYKMVFHEDDIMHPYLLESLFSIFSNNQNLIAVGTEMSFFKDHYELTSEDFIKPELYSTIYLEKSVLIYDLVKEIPLCFGSVMYQSNLIENSKSFELDKYWTLGDRPFLINFLPEYFFGIIHNKLVFYNDHYQNDKRGSKLNKNHLLNFFQFYVDGNKKVRRHSEKKFFKSMIAKHLINSYWQLEKKSLIVYVAYIFTALKRKTLSLKYFIYHSVIRQK